MSKGRRGLKIADTLTMPLDAQTSTFVVYGVRGMGKTNFAAVFSEELARNDLKFSVLDPVGVSWGLQHGGSKERPGLPVLILGGLHGDIPIEPTAGAVVADLVTDESVSTVVDVSRYTSRKMWSRAEKIAFAADYATRLFERQGEQRLPIMQIVDEAGQFIPQQFPKGAADIARCANAFEHLVELGRNVGVGVTLVTRCTLPCRPESSGYATRSFSSGSEHEVSGHSRRAGFVNEFRSAHDISVLRFWVSDKAPAGSRRSKRSNALASTTRAIARSGPCLGCSSETTALLESDSTIEACEHPFCCNGRSRPVLLRPAYSACGHSRSRRLGVSPSRFCAPPHRP